MVVATDSTHGSIFADVARRKGAGVAGSCVDGLDGWYDIVHGL